MKKTTILAAVALLAGMLAAPAVAEAGPAAQAPISGATGFASATPGAMRVTPSGVIHETGAIAELWYSGDVAGSVTCYYRPNTISADGTLLVFSCAIDGEFTWNGRTGPVTGNLTGSCTADVPWDFYCGGTQVAHGSGDLDGVTFRMTWGGPYPSASPFTYEGNAVDAHG